MVEENYNQKLKQVLFGVSEDRTLVNDSLKDAFRGIVEEKYMLVITRYPNGSSYPKIFKLGETRGKKQSKKKVKKKVEQARLTEEEVY